MKYDELPVYKLSYDLLLEIFRSGQVLRREFKYSLGERLKEEATRLVSHIYRACVSRDKECHVVLARESIEVVRMYVRLLYDLRQFSSGNVAKIAMRTDEISKQLGMWHKSLRKREWVRVSDVTTLERDSGDSSSPPELDVSTFGC